MHSHDHPKPFTSSMLASCDCSPQPGVLRFEIKGVDIEFPARTWVVPASI